MNVPTTQQITKPDTGTWLLLKLKQSGHDRACANLHRQGFVTFAPLERVTIRRRGTLTDVTRPVFPGYLFACLQGKSNSWRPLQSTLGVANVVTFDGQTPTVVPAALIEELKARCDEADILRPVDDFAEGEVVRIVTGPFAEWVGKIEAAPAGVRTFVLLDLMGRNVRAKVTLSALRRHS